jgi:hypothetical protein
MRYSRQNTHKLTNSGIIAARTMNSYAKQIVSFVILAAVVLVVFSPLTLAASDLSRPYDSETELEIGTLVSLKDGSEGAVVSANSENSENLIGVTVLSDNSLLAVDPNQKTAQVAISGSALAIVSTLNGVIKTGDLIAASPLTGIGVKAQPGDRVVGVAQQDFSDSSSDVKTNVTDKQGVSTQVTIGRIPVVISVGTMAVGAADYGLGRGLQGFATNIAGKPVSMLRIVICLMIGMIAIIALSVVVYSTIRNGVIAVSRNPLAKPAIFESMAQVMVMVVFISLVAMILMYAVLRL